MTALWGWGAQRRVECDVQAPRTVDGVRAGLDRRGTLARGLGRSYGDTALNEGRRVLDLTGLDRVISFDDATGTLVCEAGLSLDAMIRQLAPRGWFPLITPGTRYVTVGGCIANDVHGKAHHAQGTFERSVESVRVLVAHGSVVTASRTENADLFWATFGGIGLTGVVVEATLRLRRIETTYFRQEVVPARDLTEMLALLDEYDARYPYSVATLDCVATGRGLGRGVLTVGDHAWPDELPRGKAADPLALGHYPLASLPFELPDRAFNRVTRRVANRVIQRMLKSKGHYEHFESFFYPLDILDNWNRGYGRRGFIQYQFVLPPAAGEAGLRGLLEAIVRSGQAPFLNVLKRLGPANAAPLSFPMHGMTFAIDFPVRPGLVELTRRLDQMVIDAGGRVYLGKDSYLTAEDLRRMYPRVDEWLQVKRAWDPDGVFTSDQGRRLSLSA